MATCTRIRGQLIITVYTSDKDDHISTKWELDLKSTGYRAVTTLI